MTDNDKSYQNMIFSSFPQSVARRFIARKKYERDHERHVSARKIQAWIRCSFIREGYVLLISARKIQSVVRMWFVKMHYIDYISARKIQTCFRRWTIESLYREFVSARLIQAWYRGYDARRMYKDYHSARTIQTFVRCRQKKREYTLYKSAKKIQAFIRSRQVKQQYISYQSARKIQAFVRCRLLKQQYNEFISARKIQAFIRCHALRLAYRDYMSARKIQRFWRIHFTLKREREAAIAIQKSWRGFYQYSIYQIIQFEEHAAKTIQRYWRGFWNYSHYIILQYEVIKVQAFVRGWQVRSKVHKLSNSATVVQKHSRAYFAKQELYDLMIETALRNSSAASMRSNIACKRIQLWWRKSRRSFLEKRAALVIERFFIWVRAEVEREILRRRIKKQVKKQRRRKKEKGQGYHDEDNLLEGVWQNTVSDATEGDEESLFLQENQHISKGRQSKYERNNVPSQYAAGSPTASKSNGRFFESPNKPPQPKRSPYANRKSVTPEMLRSHAKQYKARVRADSFSGEMTKQQSRVTKDINDVPTRNESAPKRYSFYEPESLTTNAKPPMEAAIKDDSQSEISGITAPSIYARPFYNNTNISKTRTKKKDDDSLLEDVWNDAESGSLKNSSFDSSYRKSYPRNRKSIQNPKQRKKDQDSFLEEAWNDTADQMGGARTNRRTSFSDMRSRRR